MVQVIGVGMGRTGTISLKLALEGPEGLLGGCCYHFKELAENKHFRIWERACRFRDPASLAELKQAIDSLGSTAVVDFPACYIWKELLALYPDAKVVLTVRSFDSWWESIQKTTVPHGEQMLGLTRWQRLCLPTLGDMADLVVRHSLQGQWRGLYRDKEGLRRVWEEHIADVRASVPAGRLLVYQVSEGWGPLCKFLGRPVPTRPFPQGNKTEDHNALVARINRACDKWAYHDVPLMLAAGAVVLGAAALAVMRARASR